MKTQIIKLNKKSAVIRLITGEERRIAIKKESNVEDVIHYLESKSDMKKVFEYYLPVFNSELLQRRFQVWFPSKKELAQRKIDKAQREKYYQGYEFTKLLEENEKEVKRYVGSLKK